MEVRISNSQKKHKISPKKLRKTAQVILNALDCPDGELSILIVDDLQIEKLNLEYLNRKGPTNVIAFPMRDGAFPDITPHLLGDVVLSTETAYKESVIADTSLEERINELLIHGILHLFGYDHETSAKEAHTMEEKSRELLSLIHSR